MIIEATISGTLTRTPVYIYHHNWWLIFKYSFDRGGGGLTITVENSLLARSRANANLAAGRPDYAIL